MNEIGEAALFRRDTVTVTTTLIRVGPKSYPVNGIGSIEIRPPNRLLLFILAIGLFIIAIATAAGGGGGAAAVSGVLGAVLLLLAFRKPSHLYFHTAAGEIQALESTDREFLASVQAAVEKAVAQRG